MKNEIPFIIIGLTGPIGAGCTTLARSIERIPINALTRSKKMIHANIDNIISISNRMKDELNEKSLENLHEDLRSAYKERAYLDVINNTNHPKFIYISMSTLIIKQVVCFLDCNEIAEWLDSNPQNIEIYNLLFDFKKNWSQTSALYDDCRDFTILSSEELLNIDNMLKALDDLLEKIKMVELKLFFKGNIKELYLQFFGDNLRLSGNPFLSNIKSKENLSRIHQFWQTRLIN